MKEDKIKGIITKGVGGLYTVRPCFSNTAEKEILCHARGKFRLDGITPLPGDDVFIEMEAQNENSGYVISEILERKNSLIRPPLANLTHLFLLIPSCRPKPDFLTADKMIAILENAGIEPVIIAGKADMDSESAEKIKKIYQTAGFDVILFSAVTGRGTKELSEYIYKISDEAAAENKAVKAAFAGVSGAGKSTLITKLFPELDLKTGSVSRKTERGRHTTRHTELYPLLTENQNTFYLADTPGFSMLDFTKYNFFPKENLAMSFREFEDCIGKCRYTKCTHTKEEGCAVLEKMDRELIDRQRHENYVQIMNELKKKPEWKRQKENIPSKRCRKK